MAWGLLEQPWGKEFDPHLDTDHARRYLDDVVTRELGDDRPPDTELHVVNDLPAHAVLDAADGAWLVVLGNRGLGGFRGLLLGSVSQQVVHHADLPRAHRARPGRGGRALTHRAAQAIVCNALASRSRSSSSVT